MGKSECNVEGCEKTARSRGMCNAHYERWRLKGDPGAGSLRSYRDYANPCIVGGCERPRHANKMCKAHNARAATGAPLDAPVRGKTPEGLTADQALFHWSSDEPTDSGCVLWRGPALRSGYGSLSVAGSPRLAHRVAWEVAHSRPIPAGLVVRHACDTPLCVAPEHLLLGTPADNSGDMTARERQARGERVPTARMTEESVRELRRLSADGASYSELADRFGISKSQVSNIVRRASWGHVD